MSTSATICQQYTKAIDALRTHFDAQQDALPDGETASQYAFSTQIDGPGWLEAHLPPLAADLLPARFTVGISLTAHDLQVALQVHRGAEGLEVDCQSVETLEDDAREPLPPDAVGPLEALREILVDKCAGVSVEKLLDALGALSGSGIELDLWLHVFLDKSWVNTRLARGLEESQRPKVESFLFLEALVKIVRDISLEAFESDFCQEARRSVIPVFDFSGCLSSDVLTICGPDHLEELDASLTSPLGVEVLRQVEEILEFRESVGFWAYPAAWVTPETFALTAMCAVGDDVGADLVRQLKSFQGLLSAIYLADYVESDAEGFQVEYRGFGRTCIPIKRASLLTYQGQLKDLYQLYVYAYEGRSVDKAEIAQRFLSLIAQDLTTLVTRASEVKEATKKSYEDELVDKVRNYFEARHKIQERIKTAVAETSTNVIDLSRDVSGDLYKIAGIIAGVVAGALLKPEISPWAGLVGSLAIAVYMALVVFHHLKTVQRAYDLRMDQHERYIESFEDLLRRCEVDAFLGDKHLGKARTVFSEKKESARTIYLAFLVASLVVAVILAGLLASGGLSAPGPTPPVATPAP